MVVVAKGLITITLFLMNRVLRHVSFSVGTRAQNSAAMIRTAILLPKPNVLVVMSIGYTQSVPEYLPTILNHSLHVTMDG